MRPADPTAVKALVPGGCVALGTGWAPHTRAPGPAGTQARVALGPRGTSRQPRETKAAGACELGTPPCLSDEEKEQVCPLLSGPVAPLRWALLWAWGVMVRTGRFPLEFTSQHGEDLRLENESRGQGACQETVVGREGRGDGQSEAGSEWGPLACDAPAPRGGVSSGGAAVRGQLEGRGCWAGPGRSVWGAWVLLPAGKDGCPLGCGWRGPLRLSGALAVGR